MKPIWQQQQEQMKHQQQMMREMRERQQMAAWAEQQRRARSPSSQQFIPTGTDEFAAVENQARQLYDRFQSGLLSKNDLDRQLKDLMIQDQAGFWWMISTENWAWYKNEGKSWVRATPQGKSFPRVEERSLPVNTQEPNRKRRPVAAIFVFLLGFVLFFIIGAEIGTLLQDSLGFGEPGVYFFSCTAIWLVGAVFTFRIARRLWQGG